MDWLPYLTACAQILVEITVRVLGEMCHCSDIFIQTVYYHLYFCLRGWDNSKEKINEMNAKTCIVLFTFMLGIMLQIEPIGAGGGECRYKGSWNCDGMVWAIYGCYMKNLRCCPKEMCMYGPSIKLLDVNLSPQSNLFLVYSFFNTSISGHL